MRRAYEKKRLSTRGQAPGEVTWSDTGNLLQRRLVWRFDVTALLHVHVDQPSRAARGLQEIPALHPLVGAFQFVGRDRCRIDEIKAARAQVFDFELIDLRIKLAIVV